MKKKVYLASTQAQNDKKKEKVDQINKTLIELRKNYLNITADKPRLKNKLDHFSKLFKSKIKDDDKVNFISYHLFTDRIEK